MRALAALVTVLAALAVPRGVPAQGALSQLQTDVDQIARRARPSVVTVFAQTLPRESRAAGEGGPPARIHTRVGSGVATDESLILTTASVVFGADRVIVRTANGIQVEAELVGMDRIFNVALLRVPEVRLPPLRFAEARPPQVGDWVVALGTSFRAQPTQSVGNVAYVYREPRVPLLQLTNAVYPGNSGGAALNPRGELVGIVQGELGSPDPGNAGADAEPRPSGMSLVLPAEAIHPAYESLRREGRVRHGYLGVTTQAASVESESKPGTRVPLGALVEAAIPDGPAAKLGLRHGDMIVGFDGNRVEYPEQLARWVAATQPGSRVELVWVRSDIRHSGEVALSESPAALPEWAVVPGSSTRGDAALSRINQLEQQIRELNRRLERLRGESSGVR
ncbi:MAG TPA: S1C family serine protease [Candidatus Eisenbacteria bacterium]